MRLKVVMLAFLPVVAAAQDTRVSYLEQEMRNLQRQVQALSRQVEELGSRPARLENRDRSHDVASAADAAAAWLDAGKWQRLRVGMSELEVIGSLGPPTSMRTEDGTRVLFYAMEIGDSGFLSGSVKFRDGLVIEVQRPELR
jgi:hypothetical protein